MYKYIFITKANQLYRLSYMYKTKRKQKAALIHYFSNQVKSPLKKYFVILNFENKLLILC